MVKGVAGRQSAILAFAACALLLGSQSARAGYQTVDLSGIVNVPFAGEINGATFPTGSQTFNGVPFAIANVSNGAGGYNNFWTGGGSTSAPAFTYSLALLFPDIMGVSNVYTMINTLWGQTNTPNILDITFTSGTGASVTQDLIDGVNVRDYNLAYGNTINGTTTTQAFANGMGQVLDMQDFALPAYFATEGLASVTLTENGASGYEKAMFNALTLETGAPAAVPEPLSLAVLLTGVVGLAGLRRRRA